MVHLGNDTFAVMHRWNNVHMILFLNSNLTKSSTNPIYLTLADDRGMVYDGSNFYIGGSKSYNVSGFRKVSPNGSTLWSRTMTLPFSRHCSCYYVALSGNDPVFYVDEIVGSYPGTHWMRISFWSNIILAEPFSGIAGLIWIIIHL